MRIYFVCSLLILLTLGKSLCAQNTLAKIKFEDAEKAFNEAKYEECIKLLNETEEILGQSAPNILYLRILAGNKILEANPNQRYSLIAKLRNQTKEYLTNYDIAGLEEKYREVYEISNSLEEHPKDENEFERINDSIAQSESQARNKLMAVVESYLDAIGGREKVSQVISIHKTINHKGESIDTHEKFMFPDRYTSYYSRSKLGEKKLSQNRIIKGDECYFLSSKGARKDFEDGISILGKQNIRMNAFPELYFFEEGYKVTFVGEDSSGLVGLIVTYPDGSEERRFYDLKTKLLRKVVSKDHKSKHLWYGGMAFTLSNTIAQRTVAFSEYSLVDGVLAPFRLDYEIIYVNGQKVGDIIVEYKEIYINQNVTESDFR